MKIDVPESFSDVPGRPLLELIQATYKNKQDSVFGSWYNVEGNKTD